MPHTAEVPQEHTWSEMRILVRQLGKQLNDRRIKPELICLTKPVCSLGSKQLAHATNPNLGGAGHGHALIHVSPSFRMAPEHRIRPGDGYDQPWQMIV